MRQKVMEQLEQTATTGAYGASGVSVFMGFTVDEWGVIGVVVGIVLAVATFAFNVWFKMRYHR